jgi:hypothetical protein
MVGTPHLVEARSSFVLVLPTSGSADVAVSVSDSPICDSVAEVANAIDLLCHEFCSLFGSGHDRPFHK